MNITMSKVRWDILRAVKVGGNCLASKINDRILEEEGSKIHSPRLWNLLKMLVENELLVIQGRAIKGRPTRYSLSIKGETCITQFNDSSNKDEFYSEQYMLNGKCQRESGRYCRAISSLLNPQPLRRKSIAA